MVCVICLEELHPPAGSQDIRAFHPPATVCKMNCGHEFHSQCIWQWAFLQKDEGMQCPSCRTELKSCHHFSSSDPASRSVGCIHDLFRSLDVTSASSPHSSADARLHGQSSAGQQTGVPFVPSCLTQPLLLSVIGSLRSEAESHRVAMQEQRDLVYSLRVAQSFHMEDQRQIMLTLANIGAGIRTSGTQNQEEERERPVIGSPLSRSRPSGRNAGSSTTTRVRPRSQSPPSFSDPSRLPSSLSSSSNNEVDPNHSSSLPTDASGNAPNVRANDVHRRGRTSLRNVRRRLLPPDPPPPFTRRRSNTSLSQRREDRLRTQFTFTSRSRSPSLAVFVVSSSSDSEEDGDGAQEEKEEKEGNRTPDSGVPSTSTSSTLASSGLQEENKQDTESNTSSGRRGTRRDGTGSRLFDRIANLSTFINRRSESRRGEEGLD
jgi:hypothetical protein